MLIFDGGALLHFLKGDILREHELLVGLLFASKWLFLNLAR